MGKLKQTELDGSKFFAHFSLFMMIAVIIYSLTLEPDYNIFYYYKIKVYSLETNVLIYEGIGRDADYYWFGTGVSFKDIHGNYKEIAGNAVISAKYKKMKERP